MIGHYKEVERPSQARADAVGRGHDLTLGETIGIVGRGHRTDESRIGGIGSVQMCVPEKNLVGKVLLDIR